MSKPSTRCTQCRKSFGLLRWSRTCNYCKQEFCSKCRPDKTDRPSLCDACDVLVRERMDAMIIAKAGAVEGYQITKTLGAIESMPFDTPEGALAYVTFLAVSMGGNALLSYYCEEGITSRSNFNAEDEHFPTFKGMGTVVVVAPVTAKAW